MTLKLVLARGGRPHNHISGLCCSKSDATLSMPYRYSSQGYSLKADWSKAQYGAAVETGNVLIQVLSASDLIDFTALHFAVSFQIQHPPITLALRMEDLKLAKFKYFRTTEECENF